MYVRTYADVCGISYIITTLGLKTTYSDEIGQFTLKLKGNLRASPVISTLNGTLTGSKGEQQILNSEIQNGEIINHL